MSNQTTNWQPNTQELTGSEKQVRWANDIRDSLNELVAEMYPKECETRKNAYEKALKNGSKLLEGKKNSLDNMPKFMEAYSEISTARWFIDRRGIAGMYDALKESGYSYYSQWTRLMRSLGF